jgi:hypothetical protein
MTWRSDFGDDFTTIRDEHGFPRSHPPEVLAEAILELANADRPHRRNVATDGYIVNE